MKLAEVKAGDYFVSFYDIKTDVADIYLNNYKYYKILERKNSPFGTIYLKIECESGAVYTEEFTIYNVETRLTYRFVSKEELRTKKINEILE